MKIKIEYGALRLELDDNDEFLTVETTDKLLRIVNGLAGSYGNLGVINTYTDQNFEP